MTVWRRQAAALATAVLAGCFSPDAREGLPCSEAGDCPPGQTCAAGICSSGGPVSDAAVVIGDGAAPDAAAVGEPGPFGLAEPVVLTCPGAIVCPDARDPFLTADLTTIVFSYGVNPSNGNYDLYVATRDGKEGAFPPAASVGAINTTVTEHSPFLSADGSSLWFARQDLSAGDVQPYDEILLSLRSAGRFDSAQPVAGAVNTVLGDERSPQVSAGGGAMLFTRAAEETLGDHDVYLARFEGGQWNTIERVASLSDADSDERSLSLAEGRKALFFVRDDQIHEVLWTADQPGEIAAHVVHDELDVAPLDLKIGVWASPDGSEVWFDSNRGGPQQIYRAVRAAPTRQGWSGGRIWRRPIP